MAFSHFRAWSITWPCGSKEKMVSLLRLTQLSVLSPAITMESVITLKSSQLSQQFLTQALIHLCVRTQFCLFKQHCCSNCRAIYSTVHEARLRFFWFNQLLPEPPKTRRKHWSLYRTFFSSSYRFPCFWPTMIPLMFFPERSTFRLKTGLLVLKVNYRTVYLETLFSWPLVRLLLASK